MEKVVQGSFHQGATKFGESAGSQCTCCALFSVVFNQLIKSSGRWDSFDLDYIVSNGDKVYKDLGKSGYLMFDDLPQFMLLYDNRVDIDFLHNQSGILTSKNNLPGFLFDNMPVDASGLLLILKGICISVIVQQRHYFIFDSHSRNELGLPCPDGYSVSIKFSRRKLLEEHIVKTYLNEDDCNVVFEVQFLKVCGNSNEFIADFLVTSLYRRRVALWKDCSSAWTETLLV